MEIQEIKGLPFDLAAGEDLIRSIKPEWRDYLSRSLLTSIILGVPLPILFISMYYPFLLPSQQPNLGLLMAALFLFLYIPVFLISIVIQYLLYDKYRMWITNQRVISSHGFLKFAIKASRIEDIVAVVITPTPVERVLGLSSLRVVPLGVKRTMVFAVYTYTPDKTEYILALKRDAAVKLQKDILDLCNAKKKKSDNPSNAQGPLGE